MKGKESRFYILFKNREPDEITYSFCSVDCSADCNIITDDNGKNIEKSLAFVFPKVTVSLKMGDIDAKEIKLKNSGAEPGSYKAKICLKTSTNNVYSELIPIIVN